MFSPYAWFAIGAFVCCLNFYLSFLRYPLHRLLGRECKWVSGFPGVGSVMVVGSLVELHESPVLFWAGVTIALLDTGGLHWFAGIMLWMYLFHRDKM
jgi:hypothetical protein